MKQKNQSESDTAYQFIINKLAQSNDTHEIQNILNALLTEKEQHEIANRLKIFALLQQGLPQRAISEQLSVGIATVSRGAKAYQTNELDKLLPRLADNINGK